MTPTIAVCIVTMNRPEELDRCLASVAAADPAPDEVIVSDDSDERRTPLTRHVVERYPHVRYTAGPRRGVCANRNTCADEARSELITYIDDDSTIDPDFIKTAVAAFAREAARHSSRILVTGQATDPRGPLVPSKLNFLGFYAAVPPDDREPVCICMGSCVIPRSLLREIRFDENISYNGDERDISMHALHVGYRIIYCPEVVTHQHPSPVNREIYHRDEVTNRVYFGLKRYSLYDRSPAKFLAFSVLVLLNAVGHRLKKLQFREALHAVGCYFKAWRIFLRK